MAKDLFDKTQACFEFAVSGKDVRASADPLYAAEGQTSGSIYEIPENVDDIIQQAGNDGLIYIGEDLDIGLNALPHEYTEGYYPVALYFAKNDDGSVNPSATHWMKQESSGLWVDKHGDLPIFEPDFLDNPELMKYFDFLKIPHELLGLKDAAPVDYGRYELHGFFLVPDEGLDVGLDSYFDSLEANVDICQKLDERSLEVRFGGIDNLISSMDNDPNVEQLKQCSIDFSRVIPFRQP